MIPFFNKKPIDIGSNPKISVIMPVFLGEYPNAASNRNNKFKEAINSFQAQNYNNKELIIVADGCNVAESIFNNLTDKTNIIFKKIKKQQLFSGIVRHQGIKLASGSIICYLDADDELGPNHLTIIANAFISNTVDWIYFNDILSISNHDKRPRMAILQKGYVGTTHIAHKKCCKATWKNCHHYNHDWLFIQQLLKNHTLYQKIYGASYFLRHIPGLFG